LEESEGWSIAVEYRDLMEWENAVPFVPFRLHLTDGRHFDILNANMIWTCRHTVMLGFPDDPNEPDVPSLHKSLALMHIVRVEPLEAVSADG
jgi:hypothetical protein